MILIYNNLKKFLCVAVVLMAAYFSVISCARDSYYEMSDVELRYPIEVEISGFVYDKDTNLPISGREIGIILEVFKDRASLSPIHVEKTETDEEDGTFTIEVSAMAPFLRLTALGASTYTDGSIEYYLTPGVGPSNEYKVENQIIYLGLIQGGRLIPSTL